MSPINECLETKIAHGGLGLFAKADLTPTTLLAGLHALTVKALSEARLKDTCYRCHSTAGNDHGCAVGRVTQALKLCAGCRTIRYCSVACQKASWASVHRLECGIFRSLAPRVLPSNVRAIMRLLLLLDAGRLRPGEWDGILALEDHLGRFREAGGRRWKDLILSAKAAKVYSGTEVEEGVVLRLFGVLSSNSFVLVSSTYEPLGVAMDPFVARCNHSCEYNATVRFREGKFIDVVPLRRIRKGEEVTLSYIDEIIPVQERRAELQDRYFFECACGRCAREESLPNPFSTLSRIENKVYHNALELLKTPEPDVQSLADSLRILRQYRFKPTDYPLPSLRHALITAYLAVKLYNLALIQALVQSLTLDPILYPVVHHPLRMVHAWLCVKILDFLLSNELTHSAKGLDLGTFRLDLHFLQHAILQKLYAAVQENPSGEFNDAVERRYVEGRRGWELRAEGQQVSREEAGWAPVKEAIEAVLEEEGR